MKAVQLSTTDESHFNEYLDKIRKEIHAAAENWFHIAYFVYEMKYFEYYKVKYDNIVDCCQAEFGFKKSTTYNFINIVEQFGGSKCMTINMKPHKYNSYVGYADFISRVRGWNYSQLVSMLSLSEKDRSSVSPEMSSREIKMLKTNSKRLEKSSPDDFPKLHTVLVEPSEESEIVSPAPADEVQSSESLELVLNQLEEARAAYKAERESNHRINIKLVDMTMERDLALQQVDSLKDQIKKLKAENNRLRAQLSSS